MYRRKITASGVVTEYSTGITPQAGPDHIVLGPDGNLWFTELQGNRLGRVTPSGAITEYSAGISSDANLIDIVVGADGRLWFTEFHTARIGALRTS